MSATFTISLEQVRTDGWFERVAQRVGSFEVLCNVLGERFFAFSLITGAQVTSLTVDRRALPQSIVEFLVPGELVEEPDTERLTLADYRQYLVARLLAFEDLGDVPEGEHDVMGAQQFLGSRLLLLAPLFHYSLLALKFTSRGASLSFVRAGEERELDLDEFRGVIDRWVQEELEAVESGYEDQSALDLSQLPKARRAIEAGDAEQVIALLGGWLMPLSFLIRTPQGRALPLERRAELADALGLLGQALIMKGESDAGHQSLRLSVQYSLGGPAAGEAYARLGEALFAAEHFGQAIAPLRRAAELGVSAERVWPALSQAFVVERRYLAAWGALLAGAQGGVDEELLAATRDLVLREIPLLARWQTHVSASG